LEKCRDPLHERGALDGDLLLVRAIASSHEDRVRLHVARTDLDTEGDTALDPLPALLAAPEIAGVNLDPNGAVIELSGAELLRQAMAVLQDRRCVLSLVKDGQDDDVRRGKARRQNETVIVGMRHDETADE